MAFDTPTLILTHSHSIITHARIISGAITQCIRTCGVCAPRRGYAHAVLIYTITALGAQLSWGLSSVCSLLLAYVGKAEAVLCGGSCLDLQVHAHVREEVA